MTISRVQLIALTFVWQHSNCFATAVHLLKSIALPSSFNSGTPGVSNYTMKKATTENNNVHSVEMYKQRTDNFMMCYRAPAIKATASSAEKNKKVKQRKSLKVCLCTKER